MRSLLSTSLCKLRRSRSKTRRCVQNSVASLNMASFRAFDVALKALSVPTFWRTASVTRRQPCPMVALLELRVCLQLLLAGSSDCSVSVGFECDRTYVTDT